MRRAGRVASALTQAQGHLREEAHPCKAHVEHVRIKRVGDPNWAVLDAFEGVAAADLADRRRPTLNSGSRGIHLDRAASAVARRRGMPSRNADLKAQRTREPHVGREGRVAVRRQRLVKVFTTHAGLVREAGHVSGTRHVIQGSADQAAVARILVEACLHKEPRDFACSQVFGGSHLLNLSVTPASIPRPATRCTRCPLPAACVAGAQHDDGVFVGQIEPATGPVMHAHLEETVAFHGGAGARIGPQNLRSSPFNATGSAAACNGSVPDALRGGCRRESASPLRRRAGSSFPRTGGPCGSLVGPPRMRPKPCVAPTRDLWVT